MVIWVLLGTGALLALVILVAPGRGGRPRSVGGAEPRRAAPRAPGPREAASGIADEDPFEYDEEDPMPWWDNQFGPHGFED